MPANYLTSLLALLIFTVLAFGVPVVVILLNDLLAPRRAYEEKLNIYESGNVAQGDARVAFRVKYYLYGLLFVTFDIAVLLVTPALLVLSGRGWTAAGIVLGFFFFLVLGYAYAWRKGALEWK